MNSKLKDCTDWFLPIERPVNNSENYCQTRDVFEGRLSRFPNECKKATQLYDQIYLLTAILGEVGNNSFDHNLGNWPDIRGIFLGYEVTTNQKLALLRL